MPKTNTPTKFGLDDAVRVKSGVTDPDFDDLPIGGWAGRISDIQQLDPPMYLVRWTQQTLDAIHPVHRKRCERDGFDIEEMWLTENDLETDYGAPTKIEQPTRIVTKPLSPDDQDDRIRSVLGLTSDDPLPASSPATLRMYHRHLVAELSFPFEASCSFELRPFQSKTCSITVLSLLDPDEFSAEEYGLFCQARRGNEQIDLVLTEVKVAKGNSNRRLIDDYRHWFLNL